MGLFGLIGYPLSHSFSASYFAKKFINEKIEDCYYKNFAIESIDKFPEIVRNNPILSGLNVTIPYKQRIIPYIDFLDFSAREINAVNTIKIYQDQYGKTILKGYNTDVFGFRNSIQPYLSHKHKNALILGTGGSSKAVAYVLNKLSLNCQFISRKPAEKIFKTYEELIPEDLKDFQIIVNTTPSGMFPNIDDCPNIPYEGIFKDQILFDLIYNPEETKFLNRGKAQGAITINGYEMLTLQAEQSWKIWNKEIDY